MPGLRWSYELPDCSMPIAIDTYSHCSYNCLYCFSYFKPHFNQNPKISSYNTQNLIRLFQGIAPDRHYWKNFIERRMFIQWGGITDPFDNFEKKYGKTYELLSYLAKIKYPLCFSTKGTWWTEDEKYRKLITGQKDWYFKFSIINIDPILSSKVEQNVKSPQNRLQAIKNIAGLGVGEPILRLRPFIIGMSDKRNEYLDLIKYAYSAGARAVSTEFLCIERRIESKRNERFQKLNEALGYDIVDFYKRNSIDEGYLRLNRNIKKPYIDKMYNLCKKLGMRFYVSDAHAKDYNCNGSCCGLPAYANYFKAQMTEMICTAREKGELNFVEFLAHMPDEYRRMLFIKMEGINTQTRHNCGVRRFQTTFDFFREIWNNIKSNRGLYRGYGKILKPIKMEAGNMVYKYQGFQDKKIGDKNAR